MGLSAAGLEMMVGLASHELMLFASVGILFIGFDDLLFDILWFVTHKRGARPLYLRDRMPKDPLTGPLAIFVPAWDEAKVLPAMLRRTLSAWQGEDFRLYLGCYPNDVATLFAVSPLVARDPRLRLVIGDADGPTTKGDNLNRLWAAMAGDERIERIRFAGIVLHDAEDIVHRAELALYRAELTRHAMVQIPVLPLLGLGQQWVAGHYADEFAEAHGKDLVLRGRLGAPLPSAGVGCALTRNALSLLSIERGGQPFRADSLTEDYEMGILVGTRGLSTAFVAAIDDAGDWIVSRGAFPETVDAAVRQKSRWVAGIALAGWDHLGWAGPQQGGWFARWMLWRDRRAPLAALILLAAYAALFVGAAGWIGHALLGWQARPPSPMLQSLLAISAILLLWRLGMRGHFATQAYGWRQGLWAIPRAFVANIVAMLAARRAVFVYWRMLGSGQVVWDKTQHVESEALLVPVLPPVRAR
jgi:adsorption protein B